MGFPVDYSEMMLPRVLLHVVLLLGHLHRFLLWAFHAVGLGDLIDLGVNYPLPSSSSSSSAGSMQQQQQGQHGWTAASSLQHRRPVLIDEALPVVRFDELPSTGTAGTDCAVCLCGIAGGDEVRRLGNCRHAFHRGCLDRWMAHDQRTCPLCRAPLLPGDLCAAAPWPVVDDDELSYPSLLPAVATPTLLLSGFQ